MKTAIKKKIRQGIPETAAIKSQKERLNGILERLPEEKVNELLDFGQFLVYQSAKMPLSQINKDSLMFQQKALSKIWDNPEEDEPDYSSVLKVKRENKKWIAHEDLKKDLEL
ncbi:MAG: hypothetical protein HZA78_09200 [Candidatus Schekmanbacteria bacterium]|nr:hypothetical protein [Candidatus Schekmanbacteria bacterium]